MGHWAGNLGDSAVFDVFDQALPPHVRFTLEVAGPPPWPWRRRDQTDFVHERDIAACRQLRRDCDAAVILGGTIVTDMHGGDWPIAQLVDSIADVKSHGAPVIAVSAGIHPTAEEAVSERFRQRFCRQIAAFSVREETSAASLLAAGVPAERIVVAADLAWGLNRTPDARAAREEIVELLGAGSVIGVNVVHEDWGERDDFYAGIAADLDEFHAETGASFLFLCNEIREGPFFDAAAAAHVRRFLRSPSALLPPRWMHPEDMVARLACCELAVSMRYHFSLFSTLAGTPWTAFERGQKLRGIIRECAAPSAGEMGRAPGGGLRAALSVLWQNKEANKKTLEQTVQRLRPRAQRALDPLRWSIPAPTSW